MKTNAALVTVAIPANPEWAFFLPTTLDLAVDKASLDMLVRDVLVRALAAFDRQTEDAACR